MGFLTRFLELFIGKEGMKTITNDILKVGEPNYVLDGEGKIFEFLKFYMPQFIKKRVKAGIASKVIYTESVRKKKYEFQLSEYKYIPENYNSPLSIAVYGNNVNILIFSEENPIAIHIKSKETARSFMNYFNLMWSIAKK